MKKFSKYIVITLLVLLGGFYFFSPQKNQEPVQPSTIHRLQTHVANVRERLEPEHESVDLMAYDKMAKALQKAYEKRKLPEGDIHIILEAAFLAGSTPNYANVLQDVEGKIESQNDIDREEIVSEILSRTNVPMEQIKQSFGLDVMNKVEEIVSNQSSQSPELPIQKETIQ